MIGHRFKKLIPAACAALVFGIGAPLAAEPPTIGAIEWLDIDADCAFLPGDQVDAYDEQGGWQYVFMTGTSPDDRGYMMIDGAVREMLLDRKFYRSDFEMRQYVVADEDYLVRVFMVPGEVAQLYTNYTGAIYVGDGESATAVAFHGECGV